MHKLPGGDYFWPIVGFFMGILLAMIIMGVIR